MRLRPALMASSALLAAAAAPGSPRHLPSGVAEPLRHAFFRRDCDGDGLVSHAELAAGILSSLERCDPADPRPQAHPFGRAQCADPTLDALSFVECAVHRARRALASGGAAALEAVRFEAELEQYVGGCSAPSAAWLAGDCLGSCSECAAELAEEQAAPPDAGIRPRALANSTTILISSDWHVEPWYLSTTPTSCGAVCRFSDANATNMFTCEDGAHLRVPCRLDGKQDPPIALEESHIASAAAAGASVHFFVGDTQAHSFTGAWSQPAAITVLLDRVLDEENRRFGAQNVVWTPGNNDGPHSAIFQAQDPSTLAWADSVLRHQIVTDDLGIVYTGPTLPVHNQTALFRATGFYTKALPAISPAAYAIVLNTNLGAANPLQLAALNQTVSWIAARHATSAAVPAIYVLGHHPTVMGLGVDTVCAQMIRGALSARCREMVAGVFAGHVHLAGSTTAGLFALVPAVTQAVVK